MNYIKIADFPAALIQYLETNDLSQADLAKKLGITNQAVSRWVCGGTPTLKQYEKVLEVLNENDN